MPELEDADDVTRFAERLYGERLGPARGVLHVMAVAAEPDGAHRVLKIGPAAPRSPTDFAALSLARARVESIVVSGSVLRAEPELRYALPPAFAAWRRDVAGLEAPPLLLVLTRGELPADHPVWASEARPIVFTGEDAARELRATLPAHVEVVGRSSPSPRAALAHLASERGCRSIGVEAGPRVAVELYDPPLAIDELDLSVFEGSLAPAARGGAFLTGSEIEARLVRVHDPLCVDEPSGRWCFSRWRAPRAGQA